LYTKTRKKKNSNLKLRVKERAQIFSQQEQQNLKQKKFVGVRPLEMFIAKTVLLLRWLKKIYSSQSKQKEERSMKKKELILYYVVQYNILNLKRNRKIYCSFNEN
jgi:hypothetical protein